MREMSMVGPLGGGDRDPGVPTIIGNKHRWREPWEALPEVWEHPPSTRELSMAGPLGGGDRDPGALAINARNLDGEPLGMRCWRSGSAHQKHEKLQRWAPREVMPEIQERPPSMQKTSTVGPLGGGDGDPGGPTINAKKR
jgi:hypothetical protein